MSRHLLFLMCVVGLAACSPETQPAGPAAPVIRSADEDPFANYPAVTDIDASGRLIDERISPEAAAIDRRLGDLETRAVTLDPEQPGWQSRIVRGWFDEGRLVRLSVTEPTDAGGMSGESVWYLADASPFLVHSPEAIYVLDPAGRIVRWLGEDGDPIDVEPSSRAERERTLRAGFDRWNATLSGSAPAS